MPIQWFNDAKRAGTASLYDTNLTLNSFSASFFERVEYAQIGQSETGDLIVRPVDEEELGRGLIEKGTLYPIASHRSYARISSTALMGSIANAFGLTLSKTPVRFETTYSEKDRYLIILISKGVIA